MDTVFRNPKVLLAVFVKCPISSLTLMYNLLITLHGSVPFSLRLCQGQREGRFTADHTASNKLQQRLTTTPPTSLSPSLFVKIKFSHISGANKTLQACKINCEWKHRHLKTCRSEGNTSSKELSGLFGKKTGKKKKTYFDLNQLW